MRESSHRNRHRNRLADETSPYLLQHADNPVDWYPWGEEALELARREDKPILLSIGYSACHWCHVMAHESFEDSGQRRGDERAVREHQGRSRGAARPRQDLPDRAADADAARRRLAADDVPDAADQRPFFGGTYFPKEPRYGMPAFTELLQPGRASSIATQRRGHRASRAQRCSRRSTS